MACVRLRRFGEGFTHWSPVSSYQKFRSYPLILITCNATPILFSSLNIFASSPTVMPWRVGRGKYPTKDFRS